MALAQTNPCTVDAVKGSTNKLSSLPRCINQVYVWSLGIGALLALLMTVLGGYYYMTSAGNAEQASKGTEMIWGAVIGLVLLFGAYLLLNTINPDLVNLKVGGGICYDSKTATNTSLPQTISSATDSASCAKAGGTWYSVTDANTTPAPHQ